MIDRKGRPIKEGDNVLVACTSQSGKPYLDAAVVTRVIKNRVDGTPRRYPKLIVTSGNGSVGIEWPCVEKRVVVV